jgi:predicted nucleic acid-binding protein
VHTQSVYILRKNFSDKEMREILLGLCNLFSICNVDETIIISALRESSFKDFEDCIQSQCAVFVNADYIVTRNIKDFTNSRIRAITPQDFINLFE